MKRPFFLMNFHRDPGSETGGGGSSDIPSSAGAATAQPAGGEGANTGGGESTDGGVAASPGPGGAEHDFATIEARFDKGEQLSAEEMAAYEQWIMAGGNDQNAEDAQSKEPIEVVPDASPKDGAEGSDALSKAMAEVGAKTAEELPAKLHELRTALSQKGQEMQNVRTERDSLAELVEDLAAGVPAAVEYFQSKFGKAPPIQTQPQAQASASPQDSASPYLMTDAEISGMIDPEMGKAFNQRILRMQADLEAKFNPAIEHYRKQTEQVQLERNRALVIDDMVSVAAKFGKDYGEGVPVRELVEGYMRTGVADPRISELLETVKFMNENGIPSLELAHRARTYDRLAQNQSQAVIDAQRKARESLLNVKPSAGLGGKGGTGAGEFSQAQIDAIASGKQAAPKEWFTPEGIPIPEKMPAKVREAFGV